MSSRFARGVRSGIGAVAVAFAVSAGSAAPAGAAINDGPVPSNLVVTANGLEWVWASPCAVNGCDTVEVGKDGFGFATAEQWALKPTIAAFQDDGLCAAAYFSSIFPQCDYADAQGGYFGSAPAGGLPAGPDGTDEMDTNGETWLVRAIRAADPGTLTVSVGGGGLGHISAAPAGIDCSARDEDRNDCSETYAGATVVTLTAHPGNRASFRGFDAECENVAPDLQARQVGQDPLTCTVTIDGDETVGAGFGRTGSGGRDQGTRPATPTQKPAPPSPTTVQNRPRAEAPRCTVPAVMGMGLRRARKTIEAAGCELGAVKVAKPKRFKHGKLIVRKQGTADPVTLTVRRERR